MVSRERDLDLFRPPDRFFDTDREADFRDFFFGGGDRDGEEELLLDLAALRLVLSAVFLRPREVDRELLRRSFEAERPFFLSSRRRSADGDRDDLRRSLDFARLPRESERFLRSDELFFLARGGERDGERFLCGGEAARGFRSGDLLRCLAGEGEEDFFLLAGALSPSSSEELSESLRPFLLVEALLESSLGDRCLALPTGLQY